MDMVSNYFASVVNRGFVDLFSAGKGLLWGISGWVKTPRLAGGSALPQMNNPRP